MKRTVTFTITMDTEAGVVTSLEMAEGAFARTEIIAEGVDDPASIREAKLFISNELKSMIE